MTKTEKEVPWQGHIRVQGLGCAFRKVQFATCDAGRADKGKDLSWEQAPAAQSSLVADACEVF